MLARLLGNSVKISALYSTPVVRHNLTTCRRRLCSNAQGSNGKAQMRTFDLYPKAHVIQRTYLQAQGEGRQLTADETLARDLWAAQQGITKGGLESFKLSIMLDDTSGINTLLKAAYVGDVEKAKAAAQLLADNDDALRASMARTKQLIDSATVRDKESHKVLLEAETRASIMQSQRWSFYLFGPVGTWALHGALWLLGTTLQSALQVAQVLQGWRPKK
jgi:hypothetical protein